MSDLPRLLTLQEASAKLGGKIKPRALRTEARHGRLHLTRIAGKDFVTESDLGEMLTRCRAARKDLGSGCSNAAAGSPHGSFSTEASSTAQAAAKATVQALKERLAGTSRKNTRHPHARAP